MSRPRLFLSAVSEELRSARQAVAVTVRTLGFDPVSQDDFPTGYGKLRQWLRDQIESCEGLIQLVGHGYGAEPLEVDPDYGRVSYTQFEFLYAGRQGKKTLIIVIGDGCRRDKPIDQLDLPREPGHLDLAAYQAERRKLQQDYIDRLLRENHLRYTANNDTELQNIVLRLRDELGELRKRSEWRIRRPTDDLRSEILSAMSALRQRRANIVDKAEIVNITRLLKDLNAQLDILEQAAIIDTATVQDNVRAMLEREVEAARKRQVDRNTDVKLGAAAPDSAAPGEQFVVRFVAYPATAEDEHTARDLLRTASPSATVLLGKVACRWADGTEVTVRASGDHIEVKQAEKHFTWHGKCQSIDFLVKLDRKARARKVFLQLDVLVAGMVIGDIILEIAVIRGEHKKSAQTNTVDGSVVRSAFASYSSYDRAKIALIIGALEQVKIDFFVDCLDINPSEEWKERLRSEIDRRDRFWLFWSKSAAESKWVDWEWRTALADKGIAGIQAYAIEPDVPAPPALSKLQFNNIYALISQHAERPRLQ
jgi:hypothetical protein